MQWLMSWLGLLLILAVRMPVWAADLSDQDFDRLREQIRETLFVPDPLPALEPRTHGVFEVDQEVVAERLTYGTQFGMRVPAILYRPKNVKQKAPAMIVVNGHGGDKHSWYAFYTGVLYARGGAFVLTYDPAGEGERNPERRSGTRAHDKIERNEKLGRRQAGQMITDVMQAVSYLAQRPEVDPERIAAMGYSMGSFVLAVTGALDVRMKACVLVGGGNLDGPGEYWDNSKPMCQGFPYRSLRFLGDRAALLYALHAKRGPTLIMNGLDDSVVNMPKTGKPFFEDLRHRTIKLRGSENEVFDLEFVPGASHRPFFVTRPAAMWLESKLDLPNWSLDGLARMPTTHISEWARREKVDMDPGYVSEDREGGTRALGRSIRSVAREDLNVFTAAEWEQEKDRMIIDRWVERAMRE